MEEGMDMVESIDLSFGKLSVRPSQAFAGVLRTEIQVVCCVPRTVPSRLSPPYLHPRPESHRGPALRPLSGVTGVEGYVNHATSHSLAHIRRSEFRGPNRSEGGPGQMNESKNLDQGCPVRLQCGSLGQAPNHETGPRARARSSGGVWDLW